MPPSPSIGPTAFKLVPIALGSRAAGFLVPVVVALWFGIDGITDAWYWALALPTFVLVLASTAVATALTPALARVRVNAPERLPEILGGLLVWTGGIGLLFGAFIALISPTILARWTAFAPDTQALCSVFLWELVPFIMLTSLAAVLRSACEVHEQFSGVAMTPVLRAGTVIGVTWVLLRPLGAHALPWGLIAGEIVQVLWWGGLLGSSGVAIRPSTHLAPEMRLAAKDLLPILGGEVLVALNLVIDKGFAGTLMAGSVATLEFADKARVIPQTLLEGTLVMVGFATWSNLIAKGDSSRARQSMDQVLRWTLGIGGPVLAGMFIGRHVLVGLMFERGAFDVQDTADTAAILAWYVPGIMASLLATVAVRAHIIERNLRLVLILGLLSITLNTSLNLMLVDPMGLSGLALATTLNATIIGGVYVTCLIPVLPEKIGRRWAPPAAVCVAATVLAVFIEIGPGAPQKLIDPILCLAALACIILAVIGGWMGRATAGGPQ